MQAQPVNVTGTTMGGFYTTTVCTPIAASALPGGRLSFQGGTFNVTTSNGFVDVGNNPAMMNNFGSFTLPTIVNDPRAITWTDGSGTLWGSDGSINNNVAATATAIAGNITASEVPDPSTYLLMAAGLTGLLVASRRRRSND